MGGNSMSALHGPIHDGNSIELKATLDRFGPASSLLLSKQFMANADSGCIDVEPIYTTPLQFCISQNEPECLQVLLEYGGDPNEKGLGGTTLLHKAAKKLAVECIKILLTHKADVHICDEWGLLPLHVCCATYGSEEDIVKVVDLLIAAGDKSDVHARDMMKKTPLHHAAFHGNTAAATKLLDAGANIDAQDVSGHTPLAYSSRQAVQRRVKIQKLLMERGATAPQANKQVASPVLKDVHEEHSAGSIIVE